MEPSKQTCVWGEEPYLPDDAWESLLGTSRMTRRGLAIQVLRALTHSSSNAQRPYTARAFFLALTSVRSRAALLRRMKAGGRCGGVGGRAVREGDRESWS